MRAASSADSASSASSSSSSAGWLGEGVDVVAFNYPSSAAACRSAAWNVSVGGLLLRHSPESLRTWRRISVEYSALVSRATMAHQINLLYLDEDWYMHFELQENDQLAFATVCLTSATQQQPPLDVLWRSKSFSEYRQGALINATEVQRRQQAAGLWLLEPDVHDAFYQSSRAPSTPPLRKLQHFPPLSAAQYPHYTPLTANELDMIASVATSDTRSLSVLALHADSCESPAVQKWLSRARQLSIRHVLLLADEPSVARRCTSSQSLIGSFPILYAPPAPYSVSSAPHVTYRLSQLLQAGFIVALVDVDSVWFSQPLPLLADQLSAPQQQLSHSHSHSHTTPHAANHSSGSISSSSALYGCDVVGHTQRNGSLEQGLIALGPSPSASSFVALVHQCYAQHAAAAIGTGELPWSCVLSSSVSLQRVGLLSVCAVDVDYFPSAYRLFESGDALDSGVWPVVSPARYVHPRSGRVKEFVEGWERFSNLPPIAAPNLQQHRRSDEDDSRRAAAIADSGSDYSVCPASSFDSSLRPQFTLIIKILSFTRADSLERLLRSLTAADYGSDRVHLDISIDRPAQPQAAAAAYNASVYEAAREAHGRVVDLSSRFSWPHGTKQWRIHDSHVGLVGQWLSAWTPAAHDDSTFVLMLEDDMEVSSVYYQWLKAAICRYYFDPQQFDPHLYGISLQNQRHVVGHNKKLQQAMRRETQWKRAAQQQEAAEAAAAAAASDALLANSSSSAASLNDSAPTVSPISIDMADVVDMRGKLSGSSVYRYQLVGTWGLLLFPQHWRAFLSWYREKTQPPSSHAAVSAFTPCVPFLESSVWWARRPTAVWSQWLIRYTFERGWYCLYSHWDDDDEALAINHRERGENYRQKQGPDNKRLVSSLTGNVSGSGSGGGGSAQYQQSLPRLSSTPLFDFYFDRVHSNGESLSQRHLLLNARHWKQACKQQHSFTSQHADADNAK